MLKMTSRRGVGAHYSSVSSRSNPMADNDNLSQNEEDAVAAAANEIPAALREVTPEKLAALRAKVAAFIKGKTDAPPEPAQEPTEGEPDVPQGKPADENEAIRAQAARQEGPRLPTGADVDWSEYDLDFSVKH